ncbi:MAG: DNA-binding domain-containing protein [Deltaproteobacteria bacterium]|nr:DNA-binding domain-containing protein [Deltaproteobacteria bacterium]
MLSIRADAPSLRELQRAIAARVRDADPHAALGALADWVVATPGADLAERLAVYVDGYPARLADALQEQFPAVVHLIGHAQFRALIDRYRRGATLAGTNLNLIGAELPAYLRGDPLSERLPFLPDLAALEWHQVLAFHADAAAPLDLDAVRGDLDALAALPLALRPGAAVVASRWPIHALWQARDTPRDAIDLDLTEAQSVLVWRADFAVHCAPLAPDEAAALALVAAGSPLADLAATLADSGVDPSRVGAWFASWMQRGLLAAPQTVGRTSTESA